MNIRVMLLLVLMNGVAVASLNVKPLAASARAMNAEEIKAIDTLATSQPSYADAILPETGTSHGNRIQLGTVPKGARTWAAKWMRRVVKPGWLTSNLARTLIAVKDVHQWRSPSSVDGVTAERISDVLMTSNTTKGRRIHIVDNGATLSLRVDLATSVDMSNDPDAQARSWVREYLNIPTDATLSETTFLKREGELVHGTLVNEARDIDWWKRITVVSNGRFVFLSVGEPEVIAGTTEVQQRASIGPPNRF